MDSSNEDDRKKPDADKPPRRKKQNDQQSETPTKRQRGKSTETKDDSSKQNGGESNDSTPPKRKKRTKSETANETDDKESLKGESKADGEKEETDGKETSKRSDNKGGKRRQRDSGEEKTGDNKDKRKSAKSEGKNTQNDKTDKSESSSTKSNRKSRKNSTSDKDESKETLTKSRDGDKLSASRRGDLKRSWAEDELEVIIPQDSESSSQHEEVEEDDVGLLQVTPGEDYFSRVPDEVILNVYRFLSENDIGRAAQVCQRWNKLTFDEDMWQEKAKYWLHIPKSQLNPPPNADVKAFFVAKYKEQKNRVKMHEMEEAKRRKRMKMERAAHRCKWFMRILFYNRCADYISLICFILTTIFAVLKLDGAVDWTWREVLTPIFIPMFQLALAIPTYDLSKKMFSSAYITDEPGGLSHIAWQRIFCRSRRFRGLVYTLIVSLLVFYILLMIKMNENMDGLPAGVVAIPIFILLLVLWQATFTGCFQGSFNSYDSHKLDRLIIAAGVTLVTILVLFVVLKLDGVVAWDWAIVLIPLWILMCTIVCLPMFMICTSCCCRYWCEDNSRPMYDRSTFFGIMLLCWVFVLTPFATWFALITLNLDGDAPERPWRLIFVPIFLIEGMLFSGCVIADIAVCCD